MNIIFDIAISISVTGSDCTSPLDHIPLNRNPTRPSKPLHESKWRRPSRVSVYVEDLYLSLVGSLL